MYLLFLLFWIVLNGRITAEILIFGVVISAAVFWFICRFMGYSLKKELLLVRSTGLLFLYFLVLLREIFKANMSVLKLILTPSIQPEPAMVTFRCDLRTGLGRALLANSITLTPGTITVSIVGDEYCIHCLDREFGEGIEECEFVQLLRKMEEGWV